MSSEVHKANCRSGTLLGNKTQLISFNFLNPVYLNSYKKPPCLALFIAFLKDNINVFEYFNHKQGHLLMVIYKWNKEGAWNLERTSNWDFAHKTLYADEPPMVGFVEMPRRLIFLCVCSMWQTILNWRTVIERRTLANR